MTIKFTPGNSGVNNLRGFSGNKKNFSDVQRSSRATDGARTRGLHLGKVALYQLSYCRISLLSHDKS